MLFPAGNYRTGPLFLKSHITVELESITKDLSAVNWEKLSTDIGDTAVQAQESMRVASQAVEELDIKTLNEAITDLRVAPYVGVSQSTDHIMFGAIEYTRIDILGTYITYGDEQTKPEADCLYFTTNSK